MSSSSIKTGLIRFFGGEPLLNFKVIEKTVSWSKKKFREVSFDITTNGLLLNRKITAFLKNRSEVELIISSNQQKVFRDKNLTKEILKLPKTTININLLPGQIEQNKRLFKKLLRIGFSRFNFLPIYYTAWKQNEIKELEKNLKEMGEIIKLRQEEIYVKNLDSYSPVPLFNPVPSIDCQGDIYAGNFFLDKRFHAWNNLLKLGNVHRAKSWKKINDLLPVFNFQKIVKDVFSEKIINSTRQVDKALTKFCQSIENEKS